MPISLKTQVDRTAKTTVTARRARVGGLYGFRNPVERVPTGSPKPDVAPTCGSVGGKCSYWQERQWGKPLAANVEHAKMGKIEGFWTPRQESRTKPRGRAHPAAVTSARCAGSFGDLRGRSKHSEKQPEGVAE